MVTLPQNLLLSLEPLLGDLTEVRAVGGGDTSPAVSAQTERAGRVFVKYSDGAAGETYAAEADGLAALRNRVTATGLEGQIAMPEPLAVASPTGGVQGYLVLPWLDSGRASTVGWASFGESLAVLHGNKGFRESGTDLATALPKQANDTNVNAAYGWPRDNYLGPETQVNTPSDNWPDFYRERRLQAMAERMRKRGRWVPKWDAMLDMLSLKLPELLPAEPTPALLHGDLWGGNAMALADSRFALIDPAVYRGHHEVDLALTELFGGFPKAFYDGYYAVRPQATGHAKRRDVYQLYYLIMHLGIRRATAPESRPSSDTTNAARQPQRLRVPPGTGFAKPRHAAGSASRPETRPRWHAEQKTISSNTPTAAPSTLHPPPLILAPNTRTPHSPSGTRTGTSPSPDSPPGSGPYLPALLRLRDHLEYALRVDM